jgi:hypothetical protein
MTVVKVNRVAQETPRKEFQINPNLLHLLGRSAFERPFAVAAQALLLLHILLPNSLTLPTVQPGVVHR